MTPAAHKAARAARRAADHVGIDLGEWLAIGFRVAPIIREIREARALNPAGPERRAATKTIVLAKVDAVVEWLDDSLED